ncbi:UdgX family uracil-DNA binding protein [Bordetella bronchialis]|uniref:Type-4 uracil-DNA glycosylase n=1 Tax=Bordetella bronchialis TaxID=463025 RepID=A0A193FQR7_9BORD|nr:UdgX family uracil-DNA binding protein [Bordetella bronchialis]ANN64961.1 hydroxyacid dehydrogenase [Bordetella bronchialis]ANN69990.1 hydroxyacid dehydrogenase [Bordetella bronchialis]
MTARHRNPSPASRRPARPTAGADAQTEPGGEDRVQPDQRPATLDECRRCALWHDATQPVPGRGPRRAAILLVGEQPGDQEDKAGEPFVGPAGGLLDRALVEADVRRDDVFVTNAVKHFKWFPRGKRRMHKTPAQREVMACHYWLEKELASVRPRVAVALGATALRALMQRADVRLTANLGQPMQAGDLTVVPTYHPSFILRAPDEASRQMAYAALVQALRLAGRIAEKTSAP